MPGNIPLKLPDVPPGPGVALIKHDTLRQIIAAIKLSKPIAGKNLTIRQSIDGMILDATATGGASACQSLTPTLSKDEDGFLFLSVSPGIVSGPIKPASAYEGIPTIGTTLLTDFIPDTLPVLDEGMLFLRIEWEPLSVDDGAGTYIPKNGFIESAEFIFSATSPANTAPTVDEITGEATGNGVFHWLAAVIKTNQNTGLLEMVASKCGNRDVIICGDLEIRLIWSGP